MNMNQIKKNKNIIIILLSVALILAIINVMASKKLNDYEFVEWAASRNGDYCYQVQNMPESIEHPVYFDSFDRCMNFIKNN